MMGHSTGCQDTVRYVQNNYSTDPAAASLLGAILQAPVRSSRKNPAPVIYPTLLATHIFLCELCGVRLLYTRARERLSNRSVTT